MDLSTLIARLRQTGALDDTNIDRLARHEQLTEGERLALVAAVRSCFRQHDPGAKGDLSFDTLEKMEALSAAAEVLTGPERRQAATQLREGMTQRGRASLPDPPPRPDAGLASRTAPRPRRMPTAVAASLTNRYGQPIEDPEGLAQEFRRTWDAAGSSRGQRVPLLRASWKEAYPEDRRLGADAVTNSQRVDAVTSPVAVVAAGGVCGPIGVDYSIPMFSTADRPLRDGLPSFQANRGGLRFVSPITLASTSGASAVWTEATDAGAPGNGQTKPVLNLVCPGEEIVYVDAIPTRLGLGLMQTQFFPELVVNFTQTALAAAARTAELNILSKIAASSTSVSSGQLLGAARDLLATLDQAAAAYRYRTRISRSLNLTVVLPDWARDMIRADLTREIGHAQDSWNSLAITNDEIDALLTARGLQPIWTLDAGAAVTGSASQIAYGSQQWGSQPAGAGLLDWAGSKTLVWYLFASGSFQFLDGGEIEVDVVYDSTLLATNERQMFVETFEGVAFRGLESLQVVSTVRPNGGSAGTINTSTY